VPIGGVVVDDRWTRRALSRPPGEGQPCGLAPPMAARLALYRRRCRHPLGAFAQLVPPSENRALMRHPPNRASRGIRRGPRADLARCRRDRSQARYLTRGGRPPERPDLTTQMPAACQHLSREGSTAGEGTSRPAAPGASRRSAGGTRPGPRCSPKHESRARALP
jgi:hypothetical protein